jgi:hypothetical protein
LPDTLYKVLQYFNGALVGYDGPAQRILSKNLSVGSWRTYLRLLAGLAMRRIAKLPVDTAPTTRGLGDGSFRGIHDLSYPQHSSVNAHIDPDFATLNCTRIEDRDVIEAGIVLSLRGIQGCLS